MPFQLNSFFSYQGAQCEPYVYLIANEVFKAIKQQDKMLTAASPVHPKLGIFDTHLSQLATLRLTQQIVTILFISTMTWPLF